MFNYLQPFEANTKPAPRAAGTCVRQLVLRANISLLLVLSIIPTVNGVALIA